MLETRLYVAQRISAAILAPLVMIHLGVMIYAIQGGLTTPLGQIPLQQAARASPRSW